MKWTPGITSQDSRCAEGSSGLRVLFLCGVTPREEDHASVNVEKYGALDNAADAYQWNMINGLERQLGASIQILSAPFITAQRGIGRPRYVKGFQWHHGDSSGDVSVGFVNLFGVRNVTRELSLRRGVKKSIAGGADDDNARLVILVYAMHGPFLQQLALAKRLSPSSEICLVVPDLPQHMRDLDRASVIMKTLKRMDMQRNRKCLSYVDRFILISARQADELAIGDRPKLVVEGMIDTRGTVPQDVGSHASVPQSRGFRVVYTGQLKERYGVKDLVDSLVHISSSEVELAVCGDGEMADYVAARSASDTRLVWLGRVPREEALCWQRSADVLINPRPGTADFTKYSFPSKTLEYLSAGKPVLTYHNEGTPEEYDDHLLYIAEPGPEAIARAIESVMAMPEEQRQAIGARAKRFVETEKSVDRQMGRVLAFIGGSE